MEKEYSCFFTGHRRLPSERLEQIEDILRNKIISLIENKGVEDFIAGGALGFDTLAARTVINLKDEYPSIKLHLYFPCFGQSKLWAPRDKYTWHIIMSRADDYKYITEGEYSNGCMQKRNYKMADDSAYGIAYCAMAKSGTGMTVHYAEEKGLEIYNIADEIYR